MDHVLDDEQELDLPQLVSLYTPNPDRPMRLGIMMSGTGSNTDKIINEYMIQLLCAAQNDDMVPFEPVVVFTDNPKSSAFRITETYRSAGYPIPYQFNSLDRFLATHSNGKLTADARAAYDAETAKIMHDFGVDVIALAGYDWIVSKCLWDDFLTINVHPGDLRVKTSHGKIAYTGLGWIPSAKAILAGESMVYSTAHLVNGELDGGAILAVSNPQFVPSEVHEYDGRRDFLLGGMHSLQEGITFVRNHSGVTIDSIANSFPLYEHALDCQNRLKMHGDWSIYPRVIADIALGKVQKDGAGAIYKKMSDGVVIPVLSLAPK